jgi:hypothetical protein
MPYIFLRIDVPEFLLPFVDQCLPGFSREGQLTDPGIVRIDDDEKNYFLAEVMRKIKEQQEADGKTKKKLS